MTGRRWIDYGQDRIGHYPPEPATTTRHRTRLEPAGPLGVHNVYDTDTGHHLGQIRLAADAWTAWLPDGTQLPLQWSADTCRQRLYDHPTNRRKATP